MKRVLLIVVSLVLLMFIGMYIKISITRSINSIYQQNIHNNIMSNNNAHNERLDYKTVDGTIINIDKKNNISFIDKILNNISNLDGIKTILSYDDTTTIDKMKTIKFGSYPQTDETGNIKEPIEWLVVGEYEDKIKLLSKYILDCKCYNDTASTISWEKSSLRNWLNTSFYDLAFNDEEKQNITTSNFVYDARIDKVITDYVFIPSIAEIRGSFNIIALGERFATKGTNYAVSIDNNGQKLWTSFGGKGWDKGNSSYWLRDVDNNTTAYTIKPNGNINYDAVSINSKIIGVRPVIWIYKNNEYKIIGEKLKTFDDELRTFLTNPYGQEVILNEKQEEVDWTNKIVDIDKTNKLKAIPSEQGIHPYYIAQPVDEKSWLIGDFGYPEPPEEFKCRMSENLLQNNEWIIGNRLGAYLDIARYGGYAVWYKVNDRSYIVVHKRNGNRTVHRPTALGTELISVDDTYSDSSLIALILAQEKFQSGLNIKTRLK